MALEAGATCPHIVSSDEGTSYCGLAEQQAAAAPPEPAPAGSLGGPLPPGVTWWGGREGVEQFTEPAPAGSLVEILSRIISGFDPTDDSDPFARAVLRAVAEWFRRGDAGAGSAWTVAADVLDAVLEQDVKQ